MDDDRRAPLLRRMHSVAGVVPLGVFLVVHVLVQATALSGPLRYGRVVSGLARLPGAGAVELVFVGLPLALHALYGLARSFRRPKDAEAWGYRRPGLDLLMRITSLVLFVFVIAHVWTLRLGRALHGGAVDALHTRLTMQLSSTWGGVPWIALAFVVALAAASFHLAYGGYAVLLASGRTTRRTAAAAIGFGSVLFCVGTATVIALSSGGTLFDDVDPVSEVPCGSGAAPSASR